MTRSEATLMTNDGSVSDPMTNKSDSRPPTPDPRPFTPRPAQQAILEYKEGTMGIAAVPGSGKTWTLSRLAASLITSGVLKRRQEVLIVTLVNAAVDNFRKRISAFLEEEGRLPGLGYRVRTLHSLAHEIVSLSPGNIGLPADFSVVDERIGESIVKGAFRASYPRYEQAIWSYLKTDLSDFKRRRIQKDDLPGFIQSVMRSAISHLKNQKIATTTLRDRLTGDSPPLAFLAADVYERYEHGLATRGALDFDDLITKAIQALEQDVTLRTELRDKWPFILEDEAQDSSALQESILRILAGENGNWVRVGDPNQAIYETFTTAHPKYLRQFLLDADHRRDLPNSGRSGRPIIELANELIRWVREDHPVAALRDALDEPYIEPTPPGDPQPNPPGENCRVAFDFRGDAPDNELNRVIRSVKNWLPDHGEETVVILGPTHAQCAEVIKVLEKEQVPFSDALLRLTTSTREAAGALSRVLQHLSHPSTSRTLPVAYRVWYHRVRGEDDSEESLNRLETHLAWLDGCELVEEFVWPRTGKDTLEELKKEDDALSQSMLGYLIAFREQLQQWHQLVLLPIGELLTAIAQDLFDEPEKLAMTQLFAEILHDRSQYHLGTEQRIATLDELQRELVVIAKDQRRLRTIEADKSGFDPEAHRGEVVLATMHGAKGLEWDRVYLLSVNDYDFPSGAPEDRFRSERWFVRDSLSLEAETISQLDALLNNAAYREGRATLEARYDYARERLRLLYVGITRARKELLITSNIGRGKNQPALAFLALQQFMEGAHAQG